MDKINGPNEEIKGYILRKSRNLVNGRIGIELKEGECPVFSWTYLVPNIHEGLFKIKVKCLFEIGSI